MHLFTDERRLFLGANHALTAKLELTAADLRLLHLAWYSDARDQISRRYAPYFASSFRLANKEDILDLVIRNEAVFIQPCHLFRHDYRVLEKLVVERAIPLPDVDPRADIFALHAPGLSKSNVCSGNICWRVFPVICERPPNPPRSPDAMGRRLSAPRCCDR